MIVVIMGVSGTGKTTLGQALGQALGFEFLDADDFHSPHNIAKMRRGEPLDDHDRAPWIASLAQELHRALHDGRNVILACSALKESYRQALDVDACRLVFLTGPRQLLEQRLRARQHHFLAPSLLDSQLQTLEAPDRALQVSVEEPTSDQVDHVQRWLRGGAAP